MFSIYLTHDRQIVQVFCLLAQWNPKALNCEEFNFFDSLVCCLQLLELVVIPGTVVQKAQNHQHNGELFAAAHEVIHGLLGEQT